MSGKRDFFVDFDVQFGKNTFVIELNAKETIGELKSKLQERTSVPAQKQRILFNAPVRKDKRRDVADNIAVRDLFAEELVLRCENYEGAVPQHLKVKTMVLGNAQPVANVNTAASTEVSRLIVTTIEHDEIWYRCSYGQGYQRQRAFVCRTCMESGEAETEHVLCVACADFCHGNHDVEEWGVRYNMRCDCCTVKCWKSQQPKIMAAACGLPPPSAAPTASKAEEEADAVKPITNKDISNRMNRKRSRSSSPLTPHRSSRGSSPMSGIRMSTVPPADIPALSLAGPSTEGFPSAPVPPKEKAPEEKETASSPVPAFASGPKSAAAEKNGGGGSDGDEESPSVPPPVVHQCAFIVDGTTHKPPVKSLLPINKKNRYPRDPSNWCYCKDPTPANDPDLSGVSCMLCCSCFWSSHLKKLHSDQYRRMPCYGDVYVGDTVVFLCNTCETYVCAPCRFRCHKDHDVSSEPVIPSREQGTDNGAVEGANFSCGCRGLCAIAETVPPEAIDDQETYEPFPDAVSVELVSKDIFTGFICADCMQENPWVGTEDPLKCYHGQLPAKVTSGILPARPCSLVTSSPTPAGHWDYHGMILPVNSFMPEMTCSCAPCRAAYDAFAPRALEDATNMEMDIREICSNCNARIDDSKPAFLCNTCESSMSESFFICDKCNALRQRLMNSSTTIGSNSPAGEQSAPSPNESAGAREFAHPLPHQFFEATLDNLYALCGMQALRSVDEDGTEEYGAPEWNAGEDPLGIQEQLTKGLGEAPLQFDEEELKEFVKLNSHSQEKK